MSLPPPSASSAEATRPDRRDVFSLGAALALLGGGRALAAPPTFFASHRLPIGLQLSTVRENLNRDVGATLAQVAKSGFKTVEVSGLHGLSSRAFRRQLDLARLTCPSMHVEPTNDELSLDGDLDRVISAAHEIGAHCVVMPIFLYPKGYPSPTGPDPMAMVRAAGAALTADDFRRNAAFLNATAAKLRAHDLELAYHNHNVEFAPRGDKSGLDILLAGTDPALVSFEMDIGWAVAAGKDPIALFRSHPGRFKRAHVKDLRSTIAPNYDLRMAPAELGAGSILWAPVLAAAYAAGVREFYVEQEPPYLKPPLISAAESLAFLTKLPASG